MLCCIPTLWRLEAWVLVLLWAVATQRLYGTVIGATLGSLQSNGSILNEYRTSLWLVKNYVASYRLCHLSGMKQIAGVLSRIEDMLLGEFASASAAEMITDKELLELQQLDPVKCLLRPRASREQSPAQAIEAIYYGAVAEARFVEIAGLYDKRPLKRLLGLAANSVLVAEIVQTMKHINEVIWLEKMVGATEVFGDLPLQDHMEGALAILGHLNGLIKAIERTDFGESYNRWQGELVNTGLSTRNLGQRQIEQLVLEPLFSLPASVRELLKMIKSGYPDLVESEVLATVDTICSRVYRLTPLLGEDVNEHPQLGKECWRAFYQHLCSLTDVRSRLSIEGIKKVSQLSINIAQTIMDLFVRDQDEMWTMSLGTIMKKLYLSLMYAAAWKPDDSLLQIQALEYSATLGANVGFFMHIMRFSEDLANSAALSKKARQGIVKLWKETIFFDKLEILIKLAHSRKVSVGISAAQTFNGPGNPLPQVLEKQIKTAEREGFVFVIERCQAYVATLSEGYEAIVSAARFYSDRVFSKFFQDETIQLLDGLFAGHGSIMLQHAALGDRLRRLFSSPPPELTIKMPILEVGIEVESGQRVNKPTISNQSKRKKGAKKTRRLERGQKPKEQDKKCLAAGGKSLLPKGSPDKERVEKPLENAWRGECDDGKGGESDQMWTLVHNPYNRPLPDQLAKYSAREVLGRFAREPRFNEQIPREGVDLRADKRRIKIVTFNACWLFLFEISREKYGDKMPWKSPNEAWEHLKEVASVLRAVDADVISFCEVEDLRVLLVLAELLSEMNYQAYLIPNKDSLGQNVGILTRVDPIERVERVQGRLMDKTQVCRFRLDNGQGEMVDMVVTGVHLLSSLSRTQGQEAASRRREQATTIKDYLAGRYGDEKVIHIIAGDFNESDPDLKDAGSCGGALEGIKNHRFRLINAMRHVDHFDRGVLRTKLIDFVFVPERLLCNLMIVDSQDTSDHPVLVADISLPCSSHPTG